MSSQSADVWIEQRWVIRYRVCRGLTVKQTDEMESVYGMNLLPRRTIQRWYKQFCDGRTSAESNPQSGRPQTSVTEVNKNTVAVLIAEDPHISQRQLAEVMDMSKTSIICILGTLGMVWVPCTWVPLMLMREQMQERVRMCEECLKMLDEDGNLLMHTWWVNLYLKKLFSKSSSYLHPPRGC